MGESALGGGTEFAAPPEAPDAGSCPATSTERGDLANAVGGEGDDNRRRSILPKLSGLPGS